MAARVAWQSVREWGARTSTFFQKAALLGRPVLVNVSGHPDCNPFTNPASNPDDSLLRVTLVAERILRGLSDPLPLPLRAAPRAASPNIPEAPPIAAHLPGEAPGPAERQAAQGNPQEIIRNQIASLSHQLSFLSTLQVLNKVLYGESEQAIAISELMQLAGNAPPLTSPWSFFSQRAWGNGWFPSWNWVRCGFYYHLAYKTSLIPNAVNTYLSSIITQVQTHLTNPQNRVKHLDELVEKFLTQADSFLRDYQSGTVQFARTEGPTEDINTHRDAAIQKRYDNNLEALCIKFSKKFVHCLPNIPFFQEWRDTPYIGRLFAPFFNFCETRLNRYLRIKLKETIFPNVFKSLVLEGRKVDQRKDSRLLFKKSLNEFFFSQLKKLEERLNSPQRQERAEPRSVNPPPQLAGVVKKIKAVLDLEAYTDQRQLKIVLQRQEEAIQKRIDRETEDFNTQVQKAIEGGIHAVCHLILQYTRDPQNTNQMLAQLLTLCNAPFRRGNMPTTVEEWRVLEDLVHNQSNDLERLALDVFKKIVRDNVNEIVLGLSPEKEALAEKAFLAQKAAAEALFYPELNPLLADMARKVETGEEILPEIATLAKGLSAFGNRERKLQNDLDRLDPSYKESLQRTLAPVFEQADTLTASLERFKALQISYTAQREVVESLEAMLPHLRPNLNDCTSEEIHTALGSLLAAHDRLSKQYPFGQLEIVQLRGKILLFGDKLKAILEQRELLKKLAELQNAAMPLQRHVSSRSLFSGMAINTQRIATEHPLETEFVWDKTTTKLFTAQERTELRAAIQHLSEEKAHVPRAAEFLARAIDAVRAPHMRLHETAIARFNEEQAGILDFINESIQLTQRVRDDGFMNLRREVAQTQTQVADLIEKVGTLSREETLQTTPAEVGAVGMGAVGLLCSATANLYSPAAALQTTGALVGTGIQLPKFVHWWKLGESLSAPVAKVAAAAMVGMVAVGYLGSSNGDETEKAAARSMLSGAGSILVGAAAPALAGYFGGKEITRSSAKKAEEKVLPEVMKAFKGVMKLSTSPQIYHGAMTRIMLAL